MADRVAVLVGTRKGAFIKEVGIQPVLKRYRGARADRLGFSFC